MNKHLLVLLALASAAAPATAQNANDVGNVARDVAMTPARDLNLEGEDIPPVLANLRSPYVPVESRTCSGIGAEIAALDEALGADDDVERSEDDGDTLEDIGDIAGSIVSSAILPFRGIVRRVSGAHDREQAVLAAQIRGIARRSYLKGVGETLGCEAPAAPSGYIPPLQQPEETDSQDSDEQSDED